METLSHEAIETREHCKDVPEAEEQHWSKIEELKGSAGESSKLALVLLLSSIID